MHLVRLTSATLALFLAGCAQFGLSTEQSRYAAIDAEVRETADDYSHFLVARFASLTNDPAVAASNYANIAASLPDDISIAERAVFSALLANDFNLGLSILRSMPATVRAQTILPRIVIASDQLAQQLYPKVDQTLSGTDMGLFNGMIAQSLLAWSAYGDGDLERAREIFDAALTGDQLLDGVSRNMQGMLELAAGNDEAAFDILEETWTGGARLAVSTRAYAQLLALRGEKDEALRTLDIFRDEVGFNPDLTALADAIRAGDPITIERLSPEQGAAMAVYAPAAALAAQSLNDLPGVYFSIAVHLDPKMYAAKSLWAEALDRAGRRDEAIAMLETIPEGTVYYASARGQMAWALRREGRDDDALEVAYQTLEHDPDRDLMVQIADLLRSMSRDADSIAVLGEVIALDAGTGREDWRLFYARGVAYERTAQWPKAEADLEKALELNPDSAEVMNYLGYSWVDRNIHLSEGMGLIRQALMLQPRSGPITDSLGWAHFKLGQYDRAVNYLERAVELSPGVAEINGHLGDAYWMTDRRAEAKFQWQRTLDLTTDSAERKALQRKIDAGLPRLTPASFAQP